MPRITYFSFEWCDVFAKQMLSENGRWYLALWRGKPKINVFPNNEGVHSKK